VTYWGLFAVGAAGALMVIPLIARGIAGIALVIGAIFTPLGLLVSGLAAFGAAALAAFGVSASAAAAAAGDINAANESWLSKLIRGVEAATTIMARFFNWMGEQIRKAQWGFAFLIGKAAEAMGVVPKGTFETLREDERRERKTLKPTFDVGAIREAFKGAREGADAFINRIKAAAGGDGFHMKFKVSFEGLQETWDRLQKAIVDQEDDGAKVARAQLGKLGEINDKMAEAVVAIHGIGPAVV
jgi:hypothetical protein